MINIQVWRVEYRTPDGVDFWDSTTEEAAKAWIDKMPDEDKPKLSYRLLPQEELIDTALMFYKDVLENDLSS